MARLDALYQTMRVTAAWRDRILFTDHRDISHRILHYLVTLLWLLAFGVATAAPFL